MIIRKSPSIPVAKVHCLLIVRYILNTCHWVVDTLLSRNMKSLTFFYSQHLFFLLTSSISLFFLNDNNINDNNGNSDNNRVV